MIVLDSHVLVWLLAAPKLLSNRAERAILDARIAGEELAYAPVSLYEIAYAVQRNRLPLSTPLHDFISAIKANLTMAALTSEIAVLAAELPAPFHGDPMDRIIVATAIALDCTLITHDDQIRRANVCKTLW